MTRGHWDVILDISQPICSGEKLLSLMCDADYDAWNLETSVASPWVALPIVDPMFDIFDCISE
jgi:hypothetical protein